MHLAAVAGVALSFRSVDTSLIWLFKSHELAIVFQLEQVFRDPNAFIRSECVDGKLPGAFGPRRNFYPSRYVRFTIWMACRVDCIEFS
jgi:hypothetical protein